MADKDFEDKLNTARGFAESGDVDKLVATVEWSLGELERLTELGDRIGEMLRQKREELVELEAARERCVENEWYEGLERIDERDLPVKWAEIKLLEKIYG